MRYATRLPLYTGHWSFASDMSDDWKQYGMPELIGDLVKDAAQFKATSPIAQAARIMKRHNPQVEWVVYGEEGQGWSLPKNRIVFWSRAERFLDRHIGKHGAAAKKE